jgi:hypothetical protein
VNRAHHRRSAVLLGLASLALGLHARADGEDGSVAAATVLFDDAIKLMDARSYAEACPKLVRSQALAPSGGTLLALGECWEKSGRFASAWLAFREAASRASAAGKREAETRALERAAALEPRLARLEIRTAPTPGLQVKRDGTLVKEAELGVAVPVDGADHEIQASAPSKKPWSKRVTLTPGVSTLVEIPALEAESPAVPPPPPPDAPTSDGSSQRLIGLIVAGGGLAIAGVGGVFGLLAKSADDDARTHCRDADVTRCDARGLELTDDAKSKALVSTVLVLVGAGALVGGGVLWLTAPSARAQVGVVPAASSVSAIVRW